MSDPTAKRKEDRVWWFVLLIVAIVTGLRMMPAAGGGTYVDQNVWQTTVLALAGMWILGIAINVSAQGLNNLLTSKGQANKLSAQAEKSTAYAQVTMAQTHREMSEAILQQSLKDIQPKE